MTTATMQPTFHEILGFLEDATDKKELRWQDTPDANEFRATVGHGEVWFARYKEVPPGAFSEEAYPGKFTITFVDGRNRPIARFHASDQEAINRASSFYWLVWRKLNQGESDYEDMLASLQRQAGQ